MNGGDGVTVPLKWNYMVIKVSEFIGPSIAGVAGASPTPMKLVILKEKRW